MFAGLFPVVSMMVGEVVSSSDCFAVEANASYSAVDDESSMVNSLPCRIEVAVALAFIVGLYQVSIACTMRSMSHALGIHLISISQCLRSLRAPQCNQPSIKCSNIRTRVLRSLTL